MIKDSVELWKPLSISDEAIILWLKRLDKPLHWLKKPRTVYLDESVDIFSDIVPDTFIDRIFAVIALSEKNTFNVYTKHPKRMWSYLTGENRERLIGAEAIPLVSNDSSWGLIDWPIQNINLTAVVDSQEAANQLQLEFNDALWMSSKIVITVNDAV